MLGQRKVQCLVAQEVLEQFCRETLPIPGERQPFSELNRRWGCSGSSETLLYVVKRLGLEPILGTLRNRQAG